MSTETTEADTDVAETDNGFDETIRLIDRRIYFLARLMDQSQSAGNGSNRSLQRRIENLEAAKARIIGPPDFITALANTLTDTERLT